MIVPLKNIIRLIRKVCPANENATLGMTPGYGRTTPEGTQDQCGMTSGDDRATPGGTQDQCGMTSGDDRATPQGFIERQKAELLRIQQEN